MRGLFLGLVLFAVAGSSAAQTARAQPAAVDATLAAAQQARAAPAIGAVVLRDFQVESITVRGIRRVGEPAPVAAGDLWHLGSDGKAMTATMVARLVARGRLSWTATLAQMLPDMAADMRPEYRDVTLLDLMSHRAVLGEMDDKDPFFQTAYDDRRPLRDQRRDWVRRFLATAPAGPVRGAPKYSNEGFIIAGHLAERAMGEPYEQLMAQEVFRPLGMRTPTTSLPAAHELAGHVDGHAETAHDANPGPLNPAGGWRMSLADWARFCLDQMQGEAGRGRLLKTEGYRLLHTPQSGVFALGWGAVAKPVGRQGPGLTHAGSDGNWYALALLFPATGNGVLVTVNAAESMGGDKASSEALRNLAAAVAPPAAP
jgi:CubicO group peptidase (beta-lactamase class C family)